MFFLAGFRLIRKIGKFYFNYPSLQLFQRKKKGDRREQRILQMVTRYHETQYLFLGNASPFQKHHIFVDSDSAFGEFQERLLSCDRRLR